jgi:nucleoid-associated protein YgaU
MMMMAPTPPHNAAGRSATLERPVTAPDALHPNMGVYLRSEDATQPRQSPQAPAAPKRTKAKGTSFGKQAANRAAKELDLLWANTNKPLLSEDQHPFLIFVAGLITGVVLASLVSWLWLSQPFVPAAPATPTVATSPTAPPPATAAATPAASATSHTEAISKTYKVTPGDNLGSIAQQFYGESSPALLDKLMKANNLSSPHKLALGQTLVIPPKAY